MLIHQDLVKEDLSAHLEAIYNIVNDSMYKYENEVSAEHRAVWNTTTKANVINDFMKDAAVKYAFSQGLITAEPQRMFLLIIPTNRGRYAVHFKKLDCFGNSKNIPTKQSKSFKAQESIDDIENAFNLEAGYSVGSYGQLLGVYLTCPNNNAPLWQLDLAGAGYMSAENDMFEDDELVVSRKQVDEKGIVGNENTGT